MDRAEETRPAWFGRLKSFEGADDFRASMQVLDSVGPYLLGFAAMLVGMKLGLPLWAILLLAIPTAGFMVRAFIIFHDCCHGSFFSSRRALDITGTLLGILLLTPYADWRRSHGIHHSTAGNLDRRGLGDVWTMTVDEFRASPLLRRFLYRFYRNPVVLFIFGPFFIYMFVNRIPTRGAKFAIVLNTLIHDLAVIGIGVGLSLLFGLGEYLIVQCSVTFIGGMIGIWMFYVQHQFDPTYWSRADEWNSMDAAMSGSSWYRLPRILQWFTGNIGLHHIHHLTPRIPNYRLQRCLDSIPELRKEFLTPARSIKSISLNLWDEKARRLISFRDLARI
jgi:omega-6 fatty acid desaturase (delta-12 desaturase)